MRFASAVIGGLAALCLLLALWPAHAADLPSRKAAPVDVYLSAPAPDWRGVYLGVNAGYTWTNSAAAVSAVGTQAFKPNGAPVFAALPWAAPGVAVLNSGGFLAGGQVGYNAVMGSVLVGVEAEMDGLAGGNKTSTFVTPGPLVRSVNVAQVGRAFDWAGAATGRVGYLVTPSLLVYGKGGAGFAHAAPGAIAYGSAIAAMSGTLGAPGNVYGGWAYGGGVEWMLLPNVSAKIEYLHFDLGHHTAAIQGIPYGATPLLPTTYLVSAPLRQDVVKAGLNFHFNSAGFALPGGNGLSLPSLPLTAFGN